MLARGWSGIGMPQMGFSTGRWIECLRVLGVDEVGQRDDAAVDHEAFPAAPNCAPLLPVARHADTCHRFRLAYRHAPVRPRSNRVLAVAAARTGPAR